MEKVTPYMPFVKRNAFVLFMTIFAGCSTPNPNPGATAVIYEQFERGMKSNQVYSRQDVYALMGRPYSVEPPGDIYHCQTATWKIPNDVSGWGHLTVVFSNDIAFSYDTAQMTVRVYKNISLEDVLKMKPFDAMVERVQVEHHWFFKPDVYVDLKRNDNAKRLTLNIVGANELGLKFADELQQWNNYTFPKVITDFCNAQNAKTGD